MANNFNKIKWNEVKLYPSSSHVLEGSDNIKRYCMGGNAIVTLTSPTKVHHSYYIRAPWKEDKEQFASDIRFVYHRERNGRWVYVGEICNNGTKFRKTKSSRYWKHDRVFKGAVYIVKMMNYDFDTPMVLQHEGCCARCGRQLTDPISIERGLGPKCYGILKNGV